MLKRNSSSQNSILQIFFQKVKECNDQKTKRSLTENFNKFKIKWGFNEIKSLPQFEDIKLCFASNFSKKFAKSKGWKSPKKIVLLYIVFYYNLIHQKSISFDPDAKALEEISNIIGFLPPIKCQYILLSLRNESIKNRDWSPEEDQLLLDLIKSNKFGQNNKYKWANISQSFNEKITSNHNFRLGKHCRERFYNHLNPMLRKGEWSNQEDVILLINYLKYHQKWSKINSNMEGRNDNSVKNRFYKLIRGHNLIEKSRKQISDDKIQELIEKLRNLNEKSNQNENNNNNEKEVGPEKNLESSIDEILLTQNSMIEENNKFEEMTPNFTSSNYSERNSDRDFSFFCHNQKNEYKNQRNESFEKETRAKQTLEDPKASEMFFLEKIFKEIEKINIYERKTFQFLFHP